jgi:hypothetical protein
MNRSAHSSIKIALVFAFDLFVFLLFPSLIECQTPSASENSTAAPVALLDAIAEKTAAVARKAGCGRIDCKILVSDVNTTAGSTSKFGIRFSDEFSQALAKFLPAGHVLDRSVLKDFLQEQRIPSKQLSEPLPARWLGKKLGATTVILPVLSVANGSQVFFKLLSVDSNKVLNPDELKIIVQTPSIEDLKAAEVYGSLTPRTVNASAEAIYAVGKKHPEIGLPTCYYTPQPPYSKSASAANFGGVVLIDAMISKDGQVGEFRVVYGLPYDLNEAVLKTLPTWRCHPATLDGKPVKVNVPFEVTFRPG